MDLMVKTGIAIEREVDDAQSIRNAGVKDKRRESQPSSSSSGKSRGLLLRKGFKDMVVTIKFNHPRVGEASGLLASQGRRHVSISTNLDT